MLAEFLQNLENVGIFIPPGDIVYTCLCGFHPVACLVAIEINENRDDSRMCHPKRSAVKQALDDGRFQERPVRSICRCAHSQGVARGGIAPLPTDTSE